jgi:hypothetical protein
MKKLLIISILGGLIGCVQVPTGTYIHATTSVSTFGIGEGLVEICLLVDVTINHETEQKRECKITDIENQIGQVDIRVEN